MKLNRLTALVLAMLATGGLSAQDVSIYGHMTSSDDWTKSTGIYTFQPREGTDVKAVFELADWYGSGGCVYIDGKYYDVNRDAKQIIVYDTKALPWNAVQRIDIDATAGATDLTYDITTETVYGCFIEDGGKYSFGTLDLATGKKTKIKDLVQYYPAVAADKYGTIYAIGADMCLYTIDKTSGKQVKVGATGLSGFEYRQPQSAEFDLATNTLYLCYNTDSYLSYLYKVDTKTGAATRVMQFPQNERFVDIYIPAAAQSVGAPAKADNLKAAFSNGTGNGTVSFAVPTQTIDGKALTGSVSYTISINGTSAATGTANPGQSVSQSVSTTATGEVTVAVTLANASGKTSTTEVKSFVGIDTPEGVGNLKLTTADNANVTLTWTAPARGLHGGYIDPTNITYEVKRMPDGKVCADALAATTFAEKLSPAHVTSVYYEVTPKNSAASGAASQSNRVNVGRACTVPYSETFDSDERFATYTVIDGFGDGSTWRRFTSQNDGRSYAVCDYNNTNAKDEWLITPSIRLNKNSRYVLSFDASSIFVTKPEQLVVAYGKGNTADAMTHVVMDTTTIANVMSREWKTYEIAIDIAEDGDYNFGFHAVSKADMYNLGLTNISIEGSLFTAPVPVGDLTAQSDAKGGLTADVSFTAPSQTVEGKSVDKLTKVEILCNGLLQKTIANPAPGAPLTATVNVNSGENKVSVVAYNAAGASRPAVTKVYAGADVPGRTTVKVRLDGGKQIISWDAPKGKNGGYADPADSRYTVYRFVGDDQTVLATDTVATSCTDEYVATGQTVVTYAVVPRNSMGYGVYSTAQPVVLGGEPYELPFRESFDSGFNAYPIWSNVSRSGMGTWVIYDKDKTKDMPAAGDNDGGYIFFSKSADGDRCQLFSGNISIKDAVSPTLQLLYYQKKSRNTITIQACADTGDWQDLAVVNLDNDQPEGWTKLSLPLDRFKGKSYVQVGFEAQASGDGPIAVDDIRVRDLRDNDLTVAIGGKTHFFYGTDNVVKATVTNIGKNTAAAYTLKLYRNNAVVYAATGTSLAPDASREFAYTTRLDLGQADTDSYRAVVEWTDDDRADNNISDVLTVTNSMPKYPGADGLKATKDGTGVSLSWTAPAAYVAPALAPVTESFEGYTPFTIDDLGDWTLVDVDGAEGTFGILPLNFPYREAAKSFQLFNAGYLHMSSDGDYEVWHAHTGDQMLMAFADKDRKNDDWLISPVLSGKKQTISFWVRTISGNYPNETYEVMASSTGKDIADFVKIDGGEAPLDWTEVQTTLPEGTKYFAIRCTSEDCYLMVLDDVTYTPGTGLPDELSLIGYNVYRDGTKITSTPVAGTTYADNTAGDNGHYYAVTAVYGTGESRFSNVVSVGDVSGIDAVAASGVSVVARHNAIVIGKAEGRDIVVSSVAGGVVYAGKATTATVTVPVAAGLYIVKVGNAAKKITVK